MESNKLDEESAIEGAKLGKIQFCICPEMINITAIVKLCQTIHNTQ